MNHGLNGTDPSDVSHFIDDSWPDLFRRIRAEDPVHRCPESPYGPYWSVTRYDDIKEVEAHPEIYSSSWKYGGIAIIDEEAERPLPMFIAMDRPEHGAQRRTVAPAFSPSEMDRLAASIRSRTSTLLDELPVEEPFDWVDEVSIELTTQMLALLFGFPWEERRLLPYWSDWASSVDALRDNPDERQLVLGEMAQFFTRLAAERRAAPPSKDLLSMMMHSPAMSDMTPEEFIGNLVLLIVGGNDTTRSTMTALAYCLAKDRTEWEKLQADRSLVPNAVSEAIRWQTPLAHMRRTAVVDTHLNGKDIRAGDKVVLWFISGNDDDAVFDKGRDFRVDRDNARRHLAFGFGIHRCVGARLAELQVRILLEELLERDLRFEIVKEPSRTASPFVHGYRDLILRRTR